MIFLVMLLSVASHKLKDHSRDVHHICNTVQSNTINTIKFGLQEMPCMEGAGPAVLHLMHIYRGLDDQWRKMAAPRGGSPPQLYIRGKLALDQRGLLLPFFPRSSSFETCGLLTPKMACLAETDPYSKGTECS